MTVVAVDKGSLRTWLAGRWGILFSNPGDFAQEQLEMDRWITVLAHSFGARDVAPVALARPVPDLDQDWLRQLAAIDSGSAAVLALDAAPGPAADFSARALRAQIARSGPRFAMILDCTLRCRRTLNYRVRGDLPSPLELIGWAIALRKRDHDEKSSPAPGRSPSVPLLPSKRPFADRDLTDSSRRQTLFCASCADATSYAYNIENFHKHAGKSP